MATLGVKILPNRRKASGKLGIYISLTFKKEVRYIPRALKGALSVCPFCLFHSFKCKYRLVPLSSCHEDCRKNEFFIV